MAGVAVAVAVAVVAFVSRTFSLVSSVSPLLTWLYHFHYGCKLLRMTWSIIDRKLMNLRRLESLLLSPSPWLRLFCHLFYEFYHSFISSIIHKFLKITWYIVDRKADEFRTSSIPVDLAVACCCCLSRCLWLYLDRLLLYLCLLCAWVCSSFCVCVCCVCTCAWFVGSSVAVTMAMTGSSAPLSVFAVCLDPFLRLHLHLRLLCLSLCLVCRLLRRFVCNCAWVVRSSVYICCMPGSVPLSTSKSAVCLGPFLDLRLCLLCVCACAWFVGSSICVCCVCGCAKSVEKRANQCSIPRFTW